MSDGKTSEKNIFEITHTHVQNVTSVFFRKSRFLLFKKEENMKSRLKCIITLYSRYAWNIR